MQFQIFQLKSLKVKFSKQIFRCKVCGNEGQWVGIETTLSPFLATPVERCWGQDDHYGRGQVDGFKRIYLMNGLYFWGANILSELCSANLDGGELLQTASFSVESLRVLFLPWWNAIFKQKSFLNRRILWKVLYLV